MVSRVRKHSPREWVHAQITSSWIGELPYAGRRLRTNRQADGMTLLRVLHVEKSESLPMLRIYFKS